MSHRDFPYVTDWDVIWMALPSRRDASAAYLSVAAGARLCGPASWRWRLGNQTPWTEWPSSFEQGQAQFKVEIEGEASPRDCTVVTKPDVSPSTAHWKALFNAATYVEPFDAGSISTQAVDPPVVMSYDGRALERLLRREYSTPPPPTSGGDGFAELNVICGDILKQKFKNWSDVIAQYKACMEQNFPEDDDQYPHQQLSAFLLFHSAPPPPVFPPQPPLTGGVVAAAAMPTADVEIPAAPDGQVFLADPSCHEGLWTAPVFTLPTVANVEDGFRVTVRSLSDYPSTVRTADASEKIFSDHAGVSQRSFDRYTTDVVYRAFRQGWLAESEGDLDFHAGLSALSAYPSLLRRLALVHDLRFDWKTAPLSGRIRVIVTVGGKQVGVSPWTVFAADGDLFTTDYRSDAPKRIQNGFFTRQPDDMISQLDVDGGISKLVLDHTEVSDGQPALAVTDDRSEIRGRTRASLRENGLALLPQGMTASVEASVLRTNDQFSAAQATMKTTSVSSASCLASAITDLGTEDVVQGFRIDVRRIGNDGFASAWRDLCARKVSYTLDRLSFETQDAGFVSAVVDEVKDENAAAFRAANALFRWDGWGLSTERPGRPIDDRGGLTDTVAAARPNLPLAVATAPLPGSLVRLRYGSQYEFRVRAVDLAGNSIDGALAAAGTTPATVFSSEPYVRFEPVDAPLVVAYHRPGPGETSDLLVVRSSEHGFEGGRQWRLFPPRAAISLIETHGVLDGSSPAETWRDLAERDGDGPNVPDDAFGTPRYVVDPLSRGAALRGLNANGSYTAIPFYRSDAMQWKSDEARRVSLNVRSGKYAIETAGGSLYISLPPGRWLKTRLSSFLKGTDVRLMGIWRWRKGATVLLEDEEYLELIERGEAEALTPSREITILHAVKRPLVPCGEKNIRFRTLVPDRKLGETSSRLHFDLALDVPSSGKIDIRAHWTEQVDDPGLPSWHVAERDAEAFEMRVPVQELTVDDVAATCETVRPELLTMKAFGDHKFNDTKHKRVTYTAVVTTRFVDQFKKHGTRDSAPFTVDVPNATPPAVADVFYIVPTFSRHDDDGKRSGRKRKVRGGGGLRIYMPRGWFSSGDDEKLAIVLPPPREAIDADHPLQRRITEWGNDPLWRGRALPPQLELDHFVNKESAVQGLKTQVRVGGAEGVPASTAIVDVDLAVFPVRLDEEKNLLCADVHVAAGDAYWPFIRFAVARYQPHSVCLAHLSEIQRAAFVQLAPTRSVTVKTLTRSRFGVALSGPAYEPGRPEDELNGSIWDKPYPRVVVRVEEGMPQHDSPSLRWVSVPNIEAELAGRSVGSLWVWEGEIDVATALSRELRFVIAEYQHFPGAPGVQSPPSRLSYAEVMQVREVTR